MPSASRPEGQSPRLQRLRGIGRPYVLAVLIAAGITPFVGFANHNRNEVFSATTLARYALLVVVVLLALEAIGLLIASVDPARLAAAIAMAATATFTFSAVFSPHPAPEDRGRQLVAWLAVSILAVAVVFVFARGPWFRRWFGVTLIAVCGMQLLILVVNETTSTRTHDRDTAEAAAPTRQPADTPNVYLFLLDQYARNDVLEELTGYDNAPFHDALRERGFEVAEHSLTSYPITFLSAMGLFERGYPVDESADLAEGTEGLNRYLIGDNSTVDRFRDYGYRFIHSHGGLFSFARCTLEYADECIPPDDRGSGIGDLELALLDLTPVGSLDLFDLPSTDPEYVVDQLDIDNQQEPFFFFAHIISPHHPYRFDEQCRRLDHPIDYLTLTSEGEAAAYRNDVRCLNEQMVDAVDAIQADDPDAIVIVLSDHGSGLETNWLKPLDDWTALELRERYGTQLALRLPPRCRSMVENDTPLVHVFEIVFACLEERTPQLLDFRAFYWVGEKPTQITEVPPELLGADAPSG